MLEILENCYRCYNRQRYIGSDPLQVLYEFEKVHEREIAGLVASSLAYGRVKNILSSVEKLLARMGFQPYEFLMNTSEEKIKKACKGFRHRFTGPGEVYRLLAGLKKLICRHGDLGSFVESVHDANSPTYEAAMAELVKEIAGCADGIPHLLPSPLNGSACKRLCLFFRWMARSDEVDPGVWQSARPECLIIPLDIHMIRTCRALGLTSRKSADWKTALEVTEGFRRINHYDPVKYDFALTRASMFGHPVRLD